MIKVVRAKLSRNSTVMIDTQILHDPNLSWEAKGLMAYLETLPINADIEAQELTNHFDDTQETVEAALKELVEQGYLEKETG